MDYIGSNDVKNKTGTENEMFNGQWQRVSKGQQVRKMGVYFFFRKKIKGTENLSRCWVVVLLVTADIRVASRRSFLME